jgi:hypothetical protein
MRSTGGGQMPIRGAVEALLGVALRSPEKRPANPQNHLITRRSPTLRDAYAASPLSPFAVGPTGPAEMSAIWPPSGEKRILNKARSTSPTYEETVKVPLTLPAETTRGRAFPTSPTRPSI